VNKTEDSNWKVMNLEQINTIEDLGLREIRLKYWHLRYKAFVDEKGIPDTELEGVYCRLEELERIEIQDYSSKQQ